MTASYYSCAEIKSALKRNIRNYVTYLLPAGKVVGSEFQVGNVQGLPGKSLKVFLSGKLTGFWKDFATDEKGDLIDLWSAVKRCEFSEAKKGIEQWLSLPEKKIVPTKYQEPSDTWTYTDANGKPLVKVMRFDIASGKTYRQYDCITNQYKAPKIRPLYNLPNVVKSEHIYLVEGEKAADVLNKNGFTATTAIGGANTPLDKTDWSPLKDKHITIWPDHDVPGKQYAEKLANMLLGSGVSKIEIMQIPSSHFKGFDAADVEDSELSDFIKNTKLKEIKRPVKLRLLDWTGDRYLDPAIPQKYLVDGMFPMGCASIVAASGDTGKGLMLLDLALRVINPENTKCAFGGTVFEHGSVVILAAEDDFTCLSNRIESVDLERMREKHSKRLHLIPLPNAGGPFPILGYNQKKLELTEQFAEVKEELDQIKDLKLIIFDPLASFVQGDINADAALGAFMTGTLASLATETGAAVIVAHHMRKPSQNVSITADIARDMIRGTSALVDGVRCAFTLWSVDETKHVEVENTLNQTFARNSVYQGLIVKANHGADRRLRTYVRDQSTGLLQERTQEIEQIVIGKNLPSTLLGNIVHAANSGHPFMHTGTAGIYKQRHRLASYFHNMSRHKLESIVQDLLNKKKIVKGRSAGSSIERWLDIPGGPFAKGIGELKLGAESYGEDENE